MLVHNTIELWWSVSWDAMIPVQGHRFDPWSETSVPYAMLWGQKQIFYYKTPISGNSVWENRPFNSADGSTICCHQTQAPQEYWKCTSPVSHRFHMRVDYKEIIKQMC